MFGIILLGCSKDDDTVDDSILPRLIIQSPTLQTMYSTDIGNSNVPYRVILTAQAADETKILNLKLIVSNGEGSIILKKNPDERF